MNDQVVTEYRHLDGREVREGNCVLPDHTLTTFTVTVRHMGPLGAETIKNLIEQKHETTLVAKTRQLFMCR